MATPNEHADDDAAHVEGMTSDAPGTDAASAAGDAGIGNGANDVVGASGTVDTVNTSGINGVAGTSGAHGAVSSSGSNGTVGTSSTVGAAGGSAPADAPSINVAASSVATTLPYANGTAKIADGTASDSSASTDDDDGAEGIDLTLMAVDWGLGSTVQSTDPE